MMYYLPRRVLLLGLVPAGLLVVGTLGYWILEPAYSLFDALYMTVITLTTVGYAETHELHTRGRVFTIFLLFGGVFSLFYAATEIIRAVVSGEIGGAVGRRRVERKLAALKDHLVICGYGRMGRYICREFSKQGLPFVIIDREAAVLRDFDIPHGIPLVGDATDDEVLRRAGVERARALIVVAASDADNLFVTLSARLLSPGVFIVARAEGEMAEAKLRRAGADRVVSPYAISGFRVAQAVLQPNVVDFIELATRTEVLDVQIEETKVEAGSRLDGVSLRDSGVRREFGVIIVAIKKADGHMQFNPPGEALMEAGDTLIALGGRQDLDQLEQLASRGQGS
jgi:voltage-gated potassium channel